MPLVNYKQSTSTSLPRKNIPDAYFGHVACRSCGQLTRIEVCYPVVLNSVTRRPAYCPICGAQVGLYKNSADSNGSRFLLVAAALLKIDSPVQADAMMLESIYPEWDQWTHETFKEYLQSLI